MANKPKVLRAARDRAVAILLSDFEEHGDLSSDLLRQQAKESGYSTKQLRRCVQAALGTDKKASPETFIVCEDVVTAVFLACGCLARAYRSLNRSGKTNLPSLSTFKRRVVVKMGTDQIAYAKGGSVAYRNAQVYLTSRYGRRLHSVLLDHTELPIWVVQKGYRQAVKPWMTLVMDAETRYPLSWVITFGRPSSEEVRAALVQAMTLRAAPDGVTVVGGRPMRAIWDRGLEFLATVITESCMRLEVIPVALPAYSPHLKGRLERFWRFLKEDALSELPGYVDGPRDLRGRSALESHALGEDELLERVADWMDSYVVEHVVGDTGKTPLEMWQSDGNPIEEIAPEQLWMDFLKAEPAKASKSGIRFKTKDYVAPEITGIIGRMVEIRHLPHDHTFIEVFIDGTHLCTAYQVTALDDEQENAVLEDRRRKKRQAGRRYSKANRQRNSVPSAQRIEIDKIGRRIVSETATDDLLSGGEEALAVLLGSHDAPCEQGRLL